MLPRACSGHLYEVLELSPDCTPDDIRRQYRRLALQLHPDRTNGATTEPFQEVEEAHRVLSDPAQRQLYDTVGREGLKKLGDLGVPSFLMTVRIVQPIIFTVALFFALLLLTLVLIAVKVDGPKPTWSWAAVLAPIWVISPFFALLGLACLLSGLRARAFEPTLIGCELLLLVVAPAVACAALTGRLRSTTAAFTPFVLLYASVAMRALYGLVPAVYAQRRREEDEMMHSATAGSDEEVNSNASSTASDPSHSPCRSRTYWLAVALQMLELLCVVAFICLCYERAEQGPIVHDDDALSAGTDSDVLSFWVVFAPLMVYFGLLIVLDVTRAMWSTAPAGNRSRHSGNSRRAEDVTVEAAPVVVLGSAAAASARPVSQRGGEAYGSTSGATPYMEYDATSSQQQQSQQEGSAARDRASDTSRIPCGARLANVLLSTFYHACCLYMVCMWAAKEEVDYNHAPIDAVPVYPSVYTATFPVFVALIIPVIGLCCLSCLVSAITRQAAAAAMRDEEGGPAAATRDGTEPGATATEAAAAGSGRACGDGANNLAGGGAGRGPRGYHSTSTSGTGLRHQGGAADID